MKKEIALIIGAVVNVLLFYPLAWFPYIGSNWFILLILPLLAIILYSIYHSANLLMNKERIKLTIFGSLLTAAIILSFQFVVFLIRLTIPIVA
jgi:hypothetical protein